MFNTGTTVNIPPGQTRPPINGWIQLTKVRLIHPQGGHEHISYLGNSDGMWAREQIVAWIEANQYGFYTQVDGRRAEVKVRTNGYTKYVQTVADGYWTDNLLALPRA